MQGSKRASTQNGSSKAPAPGRSSYPFRNRSCGPRENVGRTSPSRLQSLDAAPWPVVHPLPYVHPFDPFSPRSPAILGSLHSRRELLPELNESISVFPYIDDGKINVLPRQRLKDVSCYLQVPFAQSRQTGRLEEIR